MSSIWQACHGNQHLSEISQTAWRIVEAQVYSSTRKLVDSIQEQYILEALLEDYKPPLPNHCRKHHPLLSTPFRYPPLPCGSRFGARTEPSLWYGATSLTTCLAEKAYYQLHFIRASAAPFGLVESPLTAFSVNIHSTKGINLTAPPFFAYTSAISSPTSYADSQALGTSMRDARVDAFLYFSARDPEQGMNIGLFNSNPFKNKHPIKQSFQAWHCVTTPNNVEFTLSNSLQTDTHAYTLDHFMIQGQLPFPAN